MPALLYSGAGYQKIETIVFTLERGEVGCRSILPGSLYRQPP